MRRQGLDLLLQGICFNELNKTNEHNNNISHTRCNSGSGYKHRRKVLMKIAMTRQQLQERKRQIEKDSKQYTFNVDDKYKDEYYEIITALRTGDYIK